MMAQELRLYIYALLIFSFATMGISPACAFMNGSASLIEICNAAGEVERVRVAGAENPLTGDTAPHDHQADMQECLFCFSASHSKALETLHSSAPILPAASGYLGNGRGLYFPKGLKSAPFDARGPPSVSV